MTAHPGHPGTLTEPRPMDPRRAPREELLAVARHVEALRAERLPGDPPLNLDEQVAQMRLVPADEEVLLWNVWDGAEVVGHADLTLPLDQNTHLAFTDVSVLAAWRRRGLGTRLARELAAAAGARGRAKLLLWTNDRVPAGEAFAQRLGAQLAIRNHTNQLDLAADLDRGLLETWLARAPERAQHYRVWFNDGPYPEDRLQDIARLSEVMNTAPRGELDMQDWTMTPAILRHQEEQMAAGGGTRLSAFAEHVPSGQLVGYSELGWRASRPSLIFQWATGVRPEHRALGLGRWLKAANLLRALDAHPELKFVRTGNADENRAMLGINHAMGFRPFIASADWQIETAAARQALGG